ncbi:hypothetical protein [Jeotgalibaca caeni]|uniref:hypothetical protein n=1 Tax=Jeotgalibaca caeni TaxID=3028623 RepID=UPI00237E7EB4|nr:hypothetical protein [Jeotgalibaca caeni]MDE1548886.1 hypothetical protein [Jeotgalibaca caeni]
MKFTFRPKTDLGKISACGIGYFFATWILVGLAVPRIGGNRFIDWILFLLAVTGIVGAFISLFGGLIAIVWQEDRSLIGILLFILSIPIVVLLAGFLLGSYVG